MNRIFRAGRAAGLLLAFGLAGSTAACDALLNVDNPATFSDSDLDDPLQAPALETGVIARFNLLYDEYALYSAVISDEANTGHNFEQIQQVDLRLIDKTNTSVSGDLYNQLQRARASADSFGARLERILADSASRSSRLARVQAYGALSYVLLGEAMCESPIDPEQPAISPDSMFVIAVSRANSAITTATAYKASTGAIGARADSIINMARVSAARALLNLGRKTEAAAMAAQVPAAFDTRVFYDDVNMNNGFFAATQGATGRWIGVDAAFRGLNDPRVRYGASAVTGHDRVTLMYIPALAPSFGGYSPSASVAAQQYARSTSIRISSGLEAQYIRAEAEGPTQLNVDFINSRRAIGGQAALVSPTAAEFLAAVMDQRRRDFFLDGHRVGDLRRYIKLYNMNFFPTGVRSSERFPGTAYGTATCFVPNLAEEIGNPSY